MPLYEYRCPSGHLTDEYRAVDDRARPAICGKCQAQADKIISRIGHAVADIKPYRSMIDGSEISSRSRHRAHLKQHGCIELGNETPKPKPLEPPPGLKETIIAAYDKASSR